MLELLKHIFYLYYRLPVKEVAVQKTSSSKAPNKGKKEISANQARNQTGKKVFSCSSCDKSFQYLVNLKMHTRNHTGEKPHNCTMYNKSFSTSTILENHLRTHTGEKPFTCSMCFKTFSRAENLKRHTQTHTVGNPLIVLCVRNHFLN